MTRHNWLLRALLGLLMAAVAAAPAVAQEADEPQDPPTDLSVFADYPVRVATAGETVTFDLTLRGGAESETVSLEVEDLPEGWEALFRGGGDVIEAAHVESEEKTSVDLKVELPDNVTVDVYRFTVVARGETRTIQVPLGVSVKESVPPSLTFAVELPTLKGKADTTFRYDLTLENGGNEELSINLIAEPPEGFEVDFKLTGKEVSSFPIAPGESKRLDVEVQPPDEAAGGTYEIHVTAEGGAARAATTLVAEVAEVPGQPSLDVTGPGGRLSGEATVGKETTLDVIVLNTGDAPAENVKMSASEPSGWTVEFDPEEIDRIPADTQAEVAAKIRPADKAVAGDYEITIRARPDDGSNESADFRITVRTSTMWGMVGVGIIGVAVVIVALAVMRFGRR